MTMIISKLVPGAMGDRKPCVGNIQLRPKGRSGGVFMGPFGFYCVRDAGRGPSNITVSVRMERVK